MRSALVARRFSVVYLTEVGNISSSENVLFITIIVRCCCVRTRVGISIRNELCGEATGKKKRNRRRKKKKKVGFGVAVECRLSNGDTRLSDVSP